MKKLVIIILLCTTAYGANEIRAYYESSLNLYAVTRNSTGQAWHIDDQQFEAWGTDGNDADDYDITLTDKSGSFYIGDFNTAISSGYYSVIIYEREGANPADTDPAIMFEEGYWDSSNWRTISKQLQNTITDTNELQEDLTDGGRLDLIIDSVYTNTNEANDPSSSAIADAVWDEAIADHTTGTTFGGELQELDPNVTLILADTSTMEPIISDLQGISELGDKIVADMDANSTLDDILTDTGTTLQGEVDGIQADTEDLQTQVGTAGDGLTTVPWNSNWDSEVESEVDDSLGGGTGTALTAIPWNSNWDAEVQSEAKDALDSYDPPTDTEMDTAFSDLKTAMDANFASIDVNTAGIDANFVALKAAMDANFAAIDVNTAGIDANLAILRTAMDTNFAALNDPNVEEIRGEIDANSTQLAAIKAMTDLIVLVPTTVSSSDDANSFTIADGEQTADAYNGMNIAIQDADDSHYETRRITDWTADRVVTVDTDFSFTPANSDVVYIWGISYSGLLDEIYSYTSKFRPSKEKIDYRNGVINLK